MQKIYQGKTKDVYTLEGGNVLLQFKDDVTGENGVFDPGANTVGLSIEGMGRAGLRMSTYYFTLLASKGIKTHFVSSDIDLATMTVRSAKVFGKGVEVICRYRAVGSFLKRYSLYIKEGQPLDAYVEFTLKDDEHGDPLITREGLEAIHLMKGNEYDAIAATTRNICEIVRKDLSDRGLDLYDIKLEFGSVDGEVLLIDEISAGNMRVYQGDNILSPLELAAIINGEA